MRLAFVGPVYPYRGGIAHFTARLTKELSRNNDCFVVNFSRLYPNMLFPGKTQYDSSITEISFPSERLIDSLNPLTWRKASKTIHSFKPDAVVFHYWHPFFIPAYNTIAKSFAKTCPRLAICHNIAPHEGAALQKFAARRFFRNIDGFLVHARSESSELLELKPKAIWKAGFHPLYDVFPGQDISREEARRKLNIDINTKLALYFGLIRPYKGVEVFFKACKLLGDLPNLKMLAVGEIYSGHEGLLKTVANIPAGRAELRDTYVPNEEVSLYFRAADIIVLPYLNATQSGVVPIAYACDRPVIATDVGGLSEAVTDNRSGFIVPPGDPQSLADAIRKFFTNPNPLLFAEGVAEMKRQLSWKRYAELLLELILETTVK